MSWRLVGEVLAYTSKRLDPPMHPTDRLILVTIAEEARDPERRCTPGPGVLAGRVGLIGRGLRKACQRLPVSGWCGISGLWCFVLVGVWWVSLGCR